MGRGAETRRNAPTCFHSTTIYAEFVQKGKVSTSTLCFKFFVNILSRNLLVQGAKFREEFIYICIKMGTTDCSAFFRTSVELAAIFQTQGNILTSLALLLVFQGGILIQHIIKDFWLVQKRCFN